MINNKFYSTFAIVSLILTLPLFPFRVEAMQGSVTNICMVVVLLIWPLLVLFGKKRTRVLDNFTIAHVLFFFVASFSVVLVQFTDAGQILVKSFIYFLFFIALKRVFADFTYEQVSNIILRSSRGGVILFSVLFVYGMLQSGAINNVLSSGLNFYSFTFRIFQSINDLFPFTTDLRPIDIRRNTIGGIFAFYFGVFLISVTSRNVKMRGKIRLDIDVIMMFLSFIFIMVLFSRRALIACVLMVLLVSLLNRVSRAKIVVIVGISIFLGVFAFSGLEVDNRFSNMTADLRFGQFSDAWRGFSDNPISGQGYGATVGIGDSVYVDRFVHNYHLANAYMLGVFGLLFSIYITFLIAQKITKIFSHLASIHNILLIVVFLSMLVSGAVEGIYVPLSWIIFALCFNSYTLGELEVEYGNRRKIKARR